MTVVNHKSQLFSVLRSGLYFFERRNTAICPFFHKVSGGAGNSHACALVPQSDRSAHKY